MGSTHQQSNGQDNKKNHPHQDEESHKKSSNSCCHGAKESKDAVKPCSSSTPASEPAKENHAAMADANLEQIKKELHEYKDKYLRALAESENARKRLQKEKQEMIQYALQNVIVDFLHPIDHMENALQFTQQMSEEVRHWAVGFQMILTQFKDVLANNGVVPFVSEGRPFDPHFHEAVETIATSDFPPGTVIEESVRGYKMGDRVIRPARVKVSKAPSEIKANIQKEEIEQENME